MPSSNQDARTSEKPSTKRPKAPGLEERADQIAQKVVDNLNRLRGEKEAAKKRESPTA